MRMRWMMALAILGLALPALAQDEDSRGRPGGGPPGRGQMGRGGRGPWRGGGPGGMLEMMSRRLERDLGLDEEQAAALKDIVADHQQRLREVAPERGNFRELFREMRAARESGDEARIEELRGQMEQMRGQMQEMRASGRAMMDEFFGEVELILDEGQVQRLGELREQFAQRDRERERQGQMRRLVGELPERLELSEEQQAEYDALVSGLRGQRESRWERWRELRPLMEELREAEGAGDEERVAEIRAQLEAERAAAGDPLEAFFTGLESVLTEEQQAKLAELRAGSQGRGGAARADESPDLRTIMRAVQRLDLGKEQSSQARGIVQTALRESRKLGRREREAQAELVKQATKEIVALLNAEQTEQFERLLQGERPGQGRRERGRLGRPRDGRGRGPQEPAPEEP